MQEDRSTRRQFHRSQSLRRAHALFDAGKFDGALRFFGQAIRENRWNPEVLIDAARAFGARFEPEKCARLLQRALERGPSTPQLHFLVGESYRMVGDYESAEACFRTAMDLADDAPDAALELAQLCERSHRIDEGMQLVSRVFKTWPQSVSAAIVKARLLRRQAATSEAESTLRTALEIADTKPNLQAEAWGELAEVLDGLGQYGQAWQALEHCKALLRPHAEPDLTRARALDQRLADLTDDMQPAQMRRWSQPLADVEPQPIALLTGFLRSGMTLLAQVLDAHPDVISGEAQQVFSAEIFPTLGSRSAKKGPIAALLDQLEPHRLIKARRLYLKLMQATVRTPMGGRLLLDQNPSMTAMIPVAMRVFPELKLVLALRDPRDVLLSSYLRYQPLNPFSAPFLHLDLTAARYAAEMQTWIRLREQLVTPWHEIRYEELVTDLHRQATEVLNFLSLTWHEAIADYRTATLRKQVRSPTYAAIAQPVHDRAIGRWRHYETQLAPVLPVLEPILRQLSYD